MSMRSPLRDARGLGAAGDGTHHWIVQRISGVALIPLNLWFIYNALYLVTLSHAKVAVWIGSPINTTLLVLLVASVFYHSQLGLQVVIEDYIPAKGPKVVMLLATQFINAFLAVAGILAVLKIAFGA
ncbi:MAG: succinate dehydrogenase / fumarate reductase membrane anchor subunit [Gammaproteobacteria bacterium]|jgi:succinate dehydrogenase / fumarate reductase membrane anchor subunit